MCVVGTVQAATNYKMNPTKDRLKMMMMTANRQMEMDDKRQLRATKLSKLESIRSFSVVFCFLLRLNHVKISLSRHSSRSHAVVIRVRRTYFVTLQLKSWQVNSFRIQNTFNKMFAFLKQLCSN